MTETDERPDVILHKPGDCPERYYGADCDGIGRWETDPFAVDVHGDFTKSYLCDGLVTKSAMDI